MQERNVIHHGLFHQIPVILISLPNFEHLFSSSSANKVAVKTTSSSLCTKRDVLSNAYMPGLLTNKPQPQQEAMEMECGES
jgi:hypothetical protein